MSRAKRTPTREVAPEADNTTEAPEAAEASVEPALAQAYDPEERCREMVMAIHRDQYAHMRQKEART